MADKKMKCPFCDNEFTPTKKNTRRGYFMGKYLTKCPDCKTEVLIDYEDIDFDTVE